jgi:hypothetical protein
MIDPRVAPLLTAAAVRRHCGLLLEAAKAGQLTHFALNLYRLDQTADYVVATIRQNYPALDIPFHARWRHFDVGGVDRWAGLADKLGDDPARSGRAAFDLAIVSVLLDAGSGPGWRYQEAATGQEFARSEGLGVASFAMFAAGRFSADPRDPLRCDAARLAAVTAGDIAEGFQVSADNPLAGLEGRAALLRRLGAAALADPAFGAGDESRRPGGLFDRLVAEAGAGMQLPAPRILECLLTHLGPIWPGRISLHGVSLGDTWRHPLAVTGDAGNGLVPFHKLSQWLSYSLIEPLQAAGIAVTDIDGLTGLAEYRNGGLMLDMGLITLKDPQEADIAHSPDSLLVVEWRALTVALLDLVAEKVRERLGLDAVQLPLAKVLEGGTWSAGRRIATERRAGGGPPLTIISDGTVF